MELICHRCGRKWDYTGDSNLYASCPDCKTSVKMDEENQNKNEPKPAFVLYKEENERRLREQMKDALNTLIEEKEVEDDVVISRKSTITGTDLNIYVLDIYKLFESYREFDNFLISLVQDYGINDLDELGIVVGHLKGASLITDYGHFEQK